MFPDQALPTLRQLGWTISLHMEHSISMKLNLSSSSSSVSSFPASLHTTHTAVCGRTGCMDKQTECLSYLCFPIYDNYVVYYTAISSVYLFVQNAYQIIVKVTYGDALSHNTRLLHASRPSKLFHVFAEMTLSTLGPEASLTLPAACPPASCSR